MDKQKDKPLYVAFSTQKGGAGKTTLTVLIVRCQTKVHNSKYSYLL